MPDDRLFHKKLGHSAKVNALTDFEDRVWRAYILSSDDFGVMRFAAVTLQADHDYCATRPQKAVQRALERVYEVGLIVIFEHQGHRYCCQLDWQNNQRVKHPRRTINPKPPDDILSKCTPATRQLFRDWPGKKKEGLDEDFSNSSAAVGDLARAGARETAHGLRLTADGERREADSAERLATFRDRYSELHRQYCHGVDYIGNPQRDYQECLLFVPTYTAEQLETLMVYWFNTDDAFTRDGTRSIAKFRSRISGMQQELQAKGLWTATSAPAKVS